MPAWHIWPLNAAEWGGVAIVLVVAVCWILTWKEQRD